MQLSLRQPDVAATFNNIELELRDLLEDIAQANAEVANAVSRANTALQRIKDKTTELSKLTGETNTAAEGLARASNELASASSVAACDHVSPAASARRR